MNDERCIVYIFALSSCVSNDSIALLSDCLLTLTTENHQNFGAKLRG